MISLRRLEGGPHLALRLAGAGAAHQQASQAIQLPLPHQHRRGLDDLPLVRRAALRRPKSEDMWFTIEREHGRPTRLWRDTSLPRD